MFVGGGGGGGLEWGLLLPGETFSIYGYFPRYPEIIIQVSAMCW